MIRFPIIPKRADAWLLALLVVASRIPFFAKTLFEYDSVNYAVALFHYDPYQNTPHFPGYPLHIGIAKLLMLVAGNANSAFVLEAFFLSLGSVLFVWWGMHAAVGRGAAFWTACVWALNPVFWFYGCVAAIYPFEAFFTSAVAAFGIRYCINADRQRLRATYPMLIAVIVGIAGAARPSSMLFLTPAYVIALWCARAPFRIWLRTALVVCVLDAIWISTIAMLAGGLGRYVQYGIAQNAPVAVDSIFLHGTVRTHFAMLGKMLLYLALGTAPVWTLAIYACVFHFRSAQKIIVHALHSRAGMVLASLVLVPCAYYSLINYAKPGYLLNIFSVAAIAGGVFAHRLHRAGALKGVGWWIAGWCCAWKCILPRPCRESPLPKCAGRKRRRPLH